MDVTGLGAVADLASGIINRIWPDASETEKGKLALALAQLTAEVDARKAQTEVNLVEAASPSLFTSGWRPTVGWICALALGYQYLIYPILLWILSFSPNIIAPKAVVSDVLMQLLFGLLGLAGFRTLKRVKGVIPKGK